MRPGPLADTMLQITKNQLKAFEESFRAQLHQRILVFLRQHLPTHLQGQDDLSLLKWIAVRDQVASLYNLKTEGAVTKFVVLSLLTGEDFHLNPATNRFLTHPELNGEQKMKLLSNMIAARGSR
jgi:hypothetical protein